MSLDMGKDNVRLIALIIVVLALSIGLVRVRGNGVSDGSIAGDTALSISLIHTDGTIEEYEPDQGFLSSLGVTGLYVTTPQGKELSKISYDVKLKASWTGSIDSYSLQGSEISVEMRNAEKLDSPTLGTPTLKNGEYVTVASGIITANEIDNVAKSTFSRETEVYVDIEADIDVSVDFQDGATDRKTSRSTGSVKVLWDPEAPPSETSSLSSISVSIDKDRLT